MMSFIIALFVSVTYQTTPVNVMTEKMVNEALNIMDVYTRECDFERSTQFYVSDSQVVGYDNDGNLRYRHNWDETKEVVKELMDKCEGEYLNIEVIEKSIVLKDNAMEATSSNESTYDFRETDGSVNRYHTKVVTLFEIRSKRLVVKETTFYNISVTSLD